MGDAPVWMLFGGADYHEKGGPDDFLSAHSTKEHATQAGIEWLRSTVYPPGYWVTVSRWDGRAFTETMFLDGEDLEASDA